MNNIVRHPEWPGRVLPQDPFALVFDRLFDGNLLRNGSADESSVVTSQWVPRVDIK